MLMNTGVRNWHLPSLCSGGSLNRGSMPRTEAELVKNINGAIDITVMRNTTFRASPTSYCQALQPPRAADCTAIRTGLRGKTLVHFLEPGTIPHGLVREICAEGRPTCVINRFRKMGFSKPCGIYIADGDVVKLSHDAGRELVKKIVPAIGNLGVDCLLPARLVRTLGHCKCLLRSPVNALRLNLLACGQRSKVLQAKVNANTTERESSLRNFLCNLHYDIQIPISLAVLGKARPILNLARWKIAAFENLKRVTPIVKSIAHAIQVTALHRYPTKRFLAAITKVRFVLSKSSLCILLTNSIDRARMKAEFLAASGGELVQIKARKPAAAKTQGIFLPIIAIVPHIRHRAGLLVQEAIERFNAVSVRDDHFCFLRKSSIARRISSDTVVSRSVASTRSFSSNGSGINMCVRFMYLVCPRSPRKATTYG